MAMNSSLTEKLNDAQLRKVFVHNLNRMYFGKLFLSRKMGPLIEVASFKALKAALTEMYEDVINQINRMAEMYTLINERPFNEKNNPIKSIIKDDFCLNTTGDMPILNDMDIILYVQILEHINITAYRLMKMTAPVLNNKKVEQLLTECFDESVEDDQLFVLIAKEYIE
jgi:ferritin-like metal-binding protein YciE